MKVFFTIFIFSLFPHFFIAISNENGQKRDESSAPKVDSINQLHWLVGNWEGPLGEGVLGESWLPPRGNTIAAVVRLTNKMGTEFVELIKIEKIDETLELRLNLFDLELRPLDEKPQVLKLTNISEKGVVFKGVSEGAHRRLSYKINSEDIFEIRIITTDGKKIEIDLKRV